MCLDAGINLFDTANIYSGGESENQAKSASDRLGPADIALVDPYLSSGS